MIAVVDYQKGNLKSVERGLIAAGGEAFITADAFEIAKADAIVLPGVGAFADAAALLAEQLRALAPLLGAGAADAFISSFMVFHSPQPGQQPNHFGLS